MPFASNRQAARDALRKELEGINKTKQEAIGRTPTKGYTKVGGSGPENPRTLDAAKKNPDIYTKKFYAENPDTTLRSKANQKARTVLGDRELRESIEFTYSEMKKRDAEAKAKAALKAK